MKEFKTYMGDNLIQKFSEIFSHSDRQSSSRSPEKKSRLEINETFTINRPTMPSEQTLSFPPTAADIVAYDAATSAHKAHKDEMINPVTLRIILKIVGFQISTFPEMWEVVGGHDSIFC